MRNRIGHKKNSNSKNAIPPNPSINIISKTCEKIKNNEMNEINSESANGVFFILLKIESTNPILTISLILQDNHIKNRLSSWYTFSNMSFYVYIVKCSDNTYYTGCTNNLDRRINQHNNSKKGAKYTKLRRPVELAYMEEHITLLDARRREREIKTWKRSIKEKLIKSAS